MFDTISNLHWADSEHLTLDCTVTIGDRQMPFTASADDPEEHGQQLYFEAMLGVHGPIAAYQAPAPALPTSADVDCERDVRIDGGMEFFGVRYQTRPQDRENVHGAATMALAAMAMGGEAPGDLRWHGGDEDFVWIAEDNSLQPFDAPTFFTFAKAMAAHKSAMIFAARGLKDMDPIPSDFADDARWPA